jgi:hypothetical protein
MANNTENHTVSETNECTPAKLLNQRNRTLRAW